MLAGAAQMTGHKVAADSHKEGTILDDVQHLPAAWLQL